ncbi:tyrosine-type recombinase/integrase [Flavobacterium sp. LB3P122]|uniref:site-specific integrase n=1 Tax=Flavobacterium algoriphilum TaxID=3398738 RepID=UPI003A88EB40
MQIKQKINPHVPINAPMNFSGELTAKIVIKDDYVRADGTSALYLQIFISGKRKKLPIHLSVPPIDFDKKKQRVKPKAKFSKDYNLIIEKAMADINTIEICYRLAGEVLTIDKLIHEYENPTGKIDFIKFWELELEHQKEIKEYSTYQQQMSSFRKVKKYQESILFYEITPEWFEKMIAHFKNKEKNQPNTLQTLAKNFKKYLHIANKKGIITPLHYTDIKTPRCLSNRTFLSGAEIQKLNEYYTSGFINESLKAILGRFLFSCFTGLRISDIKAITKENIVGDVLIFFAKKTTKLQRVQLNQSALSFVNEETIFTGTYSEAHINRELKVIAKTCGITKRVTFHVARHSFATNFLVCGGRVEVLQKLLGHSKIEQTMEYVHIVESISNIQIHHMDEILNKKATD